MIESFQKTIDISTDIWYNTLKDTVSEGAIYAMREPRDAVNSVGGIFKNRTWLMLTAIVA